MQTSNAPPHVLKSSIGIDSVFLQFRGINKFDVDRFCREYSWRYKGNERGKYIRKWKIFLAGGQPITVVYHFVSKITTFQIGMLMNYSKKMCDQHYFVQDVVDYFSSRPVYISKIDISVDINTPLALLDVQSNVPVVVKTAGTTTYHNRKNNDSVLCIYDKAAQMQIYSTPLTRFEVRLNGKMGQWKVKDLLENNHSLIKIATKILDDFTNNILIRIGGKQYNFAIDVTDVKSALENFVGLAHGDNIKFKDHFRIEKAIKDRDNFFSWMKSHKLFSIEKVKPFVKGKKQQYLKEVNLDHKTFNKAISFYKGIPNFKLSA